MKKKTSPKSRALAALKKISTGKPRTTTFGVKSKDYDKEQKGGPGKEMKY